MQGTIKALRIDGGYGFITPAGDDPSARGDHFFHWTDVEGAAIAELKIGQRVEFTSTMDPKGLKALEVRPVAAGASG
jgi:cold shock CspA family protein